MHPFGETCLAARVILEESIQKKSAQSGGNPDRTLRGEHTDSKKKIFKSQKGIPLQRDSKHAPGIQTKSLQKGPPGCRYSIGTVKSRPKTVPKFHLTGMPALGLFIGLFRFHNVELEGNVAPISAGLRDHLGRNHLVAIFAILIKGHQLFATMSSDEFKKDKHYPKKNFFYGICLFCFR